MSKKVAVYGSGWPAAQSALTLADLGVEVELILPGPALDTDLPLEPGLNLWPLLLRAAVHPNIHITPGTSLQSVEGRAGAFTLRGARAARFIKTDLCTACGDCERVCSVRLDPDSPQSRTAIHRPGVTAKSVPSTFMIEKDGISPCRGGCPLEINVHGYVSLIRQGKVDKALQLINTRAPLAGVLGRLCTHPCETQCSRGKVDQPLYIQALHRYAADHGAEEPLYQYKRETRRAEKIAVIGSGPAGLTAAWELARLGYQPTVFEAHETAGGMLATGIPAFRLPEEVRLKEINAIRQMGVEIRTGQAFGREITLDSLRRDGYQAVFLAIGAHCNNRLNIPGEELSGVVDCISWLRDFNAHRQEQLDEKIVVIGGGNSAVDSARSAKRLSRRDVRILCLTEEMTAVPEETEEALKEGIPIDYNNSALEILGENGRVTGLRVIKVRNVQFDSEGRISLERIEGSEYILPADRVIVAIGQRPDSACLNITDLKTNRNATIVADPLTLQTGLPGVFAGGDAVTGSKNVVSAMAAGLRAAESIDRFIRDVSLTEGRTLDPLKTVEIDVAQKKAVPRPRVEMPSLEVAQRAAGYAETNLGLSAAMVAQESERCLDCAGCCECLECESVCQVKAVFHADQPVPFETVAAGLVDLTASAPVVPGPGIYNLNVSSAANIAAANAAAADDNGTVLAALAAAGALSLQVARDLHLLSLETASSTAAGPQFETARPETDITVFLCSCGEANSSVLDFDHLMSAALEMPGVTQVHHIEQSCTPEGAEIIRAALETDGTRQLVLAACRCCDWDQVCFSCSDRRVMCRQNLNRVLSPDCRVEYVNIREMCAWLYRDDPTAATRNAQQLIKAGVRRASRSKLPVSCNALTNRALVLSGSAAGLSAASALAAAGCAVTLLSTLDDLYFKTLSPADRVAAEALLREMSGPGIEMLPWPDALVLNGTPGRYEAVIRHGGRETTVPAGVVITDIAGIPSHRLQWLGDSHLLAMQIQRRHNEYTDPLHDIKRQYQHSIRDTAALLFLGLPDQVDWLRQVAAGEAAAGRALSILSQDALPARGSAVIVNRRLCRGCGDCAAVCSLIELKPVQAGLCCAEVDPAICLGCGACVAVCPTGAILQPAQTEGDIEAALEEVLEGGED